MVVLMKDHVFDDVVFKVLYLVKEEASMDSADVDNSENSYSPVRITVSEDVLPFLTIFIILWFTRRKPF